jgi:hypothetical protein
MVAEGLKWNALMPFARRYGRLKRVITTTQDGDGEITRTRRTRSMRRARSGRTSEGDPSIVPGVMPILFARHLVECTVFLSLKEMADRLPNFTEYCGCRPGDEWKCDTSDDPFWINTYVEMLKVPRRFTPRSLPGRVPSTSWDHIAQETVPMSAGGL